MKSRSEFVTVPALSRGFVPGDAGRTPMRGPLVLEDQTGGRSLFYDLVTGPSGFAARNADDTVRGLGESSLPDRLLPGGGFKDDLLRALSRVADIEEDFPGHARVVARYALLLAQTLGLTDELFLRELERGAHLHDIGKAGIPRSILCKVGPLTAVEREVMMAHPTIGYGLIRGQGVLGREGHVVLFHHERYDGRGYPCGLSRTSIPLLARIFSVADTLDAITSDRPYRFRRGFDRAWDEIVGGRGTQFDPEVVDAFRCTPEYDWQSVKQLTLPAHDSRMIH
jgi:HD-GYP domain-containing protein (c-di-GMP phosphodiesterase class II)